jgi:formate transporter
MMPAIAKRRQSPRNQNSLDALLPSEMAERAEQIGVEKTRRDIFGLLALAVLAGAFIAFGAMLSTTATAGADGVVPFGLVRLLAGVSFSLGLILVIIGGTELFTGNNLLVMAYAAGKVSAGEIARAWALVYAGNLAAALGVAILVKGGAAEPFWLAAGNSAEAYPNLTLLDAAANLVMVTAGIMVGGVLVGVTYWFIYLHKRGTP